MPVVQRLLATLFTLWLAATLAFFALRMLPGDAISAQLTESGASRAVIDERRALLRLTEPLPAQYAHFIVGLIHGDLGYSLLDSLPVTELIAQQLTPTVSLALGATAAAIAVGLALGIAGGLEPHHGGLTIARLVTDLTLSVPIYWSGTLVIYLSTAMLPPATLEQADAYLLPVMLLGLHSSGAIARIIQTNLRETLRADFVRTARAKGLTERQIIWRHVLRAGLPPTISVIALQAGFLLGGAVITESLFARPGIGRLLLNRTIKQDYPVVQGIVILASITYSVVNLLADFGRRLLDPRPE